METVISESSRYVLIILITLYTLFGFTVFRYKNIEKQKKIFQKQRFIMYMIHFLGYLLIFLHTKDFVLLGFYILELLVLISTNMIYRIFYKRLSQLVFNHMQMLLVIGFVVLGRLSINYITKQFFFIVVGLYGCLFIPQLIRKMKRLSEWGWIYGFTGFFTLASVLVIGKSKYGAKNWIILGPISIQPSEFVKILFVFFVASLLAKSTTLKDVFKTTLMAGGYILILVLEKDLGAALIFFMTYIFMLYIATQKSFYLLAGFGSGAIASVISYQLFSHVRVRVKAWQNPWNIIDGQGYQITQSLFAIGTGGWFGMGLGQGLPLNIPVRESDFVFAAISEELGGIFAICIILIYLSCFMMFINISMKMKHKFYKLIALGLSIIFIFQTFLTIGGVTKFIPSTGVTLPLISYGGSSILSTIIIFSIIQGLYSLEQDEEDNIEKIRKRRAASAQ